MKHWREELAAMGYRFQFITLAGWHALNLSMFELAQAYREDGMYGYSQLQQREFGLEHAGYRATKHQAFVGTGYFDAVQNVITSGQCSTAALAGSTEQEQYHAVAHTEMRRQNVA
jgi:isocitrate lyase